MRNRGFSLVEMLIVLGVISLAVVGVMQLQKNLGQVQVQAQSAGDYIEIQKDINFYLREEKSCGASFKTKSFNGATIQATPLTGLEIWSADQTGAQNRKMFFPTQTYGKLTIGQISLSMPDYTAATNFSVGTNQNFKAEIKISVTKTELGIVKSLKDIIVPINLIFDTDSAGLSTIQSCKLGAGIGAGLKVVASNGTVLGYFLDLIVGGKCQFSSPIGMTRGFQYVDFSNNYKQVTCASQPDAFAIFDGPNCTGTAALSYSIYISDISKFMVYACTGAATCTTNIMQPVGGFIPGFTAMSKRNAVGTCLPHTEPAGSLFYSLGSPTISDPCGLGMCTLQP